MGMNIFRILGDVSHTISKCILIIAIHRNKSAEGVSLITQALYAVVFCTRYLDLFFDNPMDNMWNFVLKIFYITSSFYILFVMLRVYARTREREKAWKLGAWCLGLSLVFAPIVTFIFVKSGHRGPLRMLEVFSLILESVCVLPQLLLLRQTTVPTVIDSFYLVTLGAYRAFYILNWIERGINDPYKPPAESVIFGVLQTLLYVDFAWVYYTRQRVKLRAGGLVDSDDLRKSWLLSRIFGKPAEDEEDEESRPVLGDEEGEDSRGRPPQPRRNGSTKWGKKGISVSADHDVLDTESERQRHLDAEIDAPDAQMKDPDELALNLEDDSDDDDGVLPTNTAGTGKPTGIGGGEEWREGSSK